MRWHALRRPTNRCFSGETDRRVMRIMEELCRKDPSLGSRSLVVLLERDYGIPINRKRVGRRAQGLEAIWCFVSRPFG